MTSALRQQTAKRAVSTSTMWTHQAIECLLSEVRKRKSLYDQRHIDYLNRTKRRSCMESISKILLEKEELEVTADDVKSKIQVLRSQLNKELRYMARSKKYKPKLWCFKKMEFLKPFCGLRTNTPHPMPVAPIANGHHKGKTPKTSVDQNDNMSSSTFEADVPSSSNILTSKALETAEPTETTETSNENDCNNYADLNQQFYDTIALTQQIVQNRIAAKLQKTETPRKQSSWEGELVKSQLDLITDETIRSDTMWEIQCVLRRGIEQDRVLPRRRRNNRRSSLPVSEFSADGSCISLDSTDSLDKYAVPTQDQNNTPVQ